MKQTHLYRWRVAGALCMAALLSACNDDPDAMLESARKGLARHDLKTAIIQAKNLLQQKPNQAEGRFLLGAALLDSGDPVGAESELRRALQLRYPADKVQPALARAVLAQGRAKRVTDEFGGLKLGRAAAQADLQLSLMRAWALQERADDAAEALAAALASAPASAQVQLAHARALALRHAWGDAQTVLDALISIDPANPEAWKLKGDLYSQLKSQAAEAEAAWRTALEIQPDFADGQVALMQWLTAHHQLEAAARQLASLQKRTPDSPLTWYLSGQLAYEKKELKSAAQWAQRFLHARPDNALGLQLAGAVELQLEHWPQALDYLARAVQRAPGLELARKLLVTSYLHEQQAAMALEALQPVLRQKPEDPGLLVLAGEVYLQNGELARAEQYFQMAVQQSPDNPGARTMQAMLHMVQDPAHTSPQALQQVVAADPGTAADMTLVGLLIRQRKPEQALAALAAAEKKQPDQPVTSYVRAQVLAAMKDRAGARRSLQRALALAPNYFPAIRGLAAMDLADKKPQEARQRYEALLKAEPHHVLGRLALAELAERSGAPVAEVARLLGDAVAADPARREARLALVDLYLRSQQDDQALVAAQSAAVVLPDDTQVLDALGRSQRAAGQTNQALVTYRKLAEVNPRSTLPWLRMADIAMGVADKPSAIRSLQKAIAMQPDFPDGQRALISLYVSDKRWNDALDVARGLQQRNPRQYIGYLLEAEIQRAAKDRSKALAALQNGLRQAPGTQLAMQLHALLLQGEQGVREAERFGAQWQQEHPQDAGFVFYLGDQALARKDINAAAQYYSAVLRQQPENAMALNNLAWIAGQQHKKEAIGFAGRAVALAPDQPSFLDTLAMLYSDRGEHAQALEIQNRALQLQPQNPQVKLNLARIALRAGQKELAKMRLDELSALGDAFPAQDELLALRQQLAGP